LPETKLQVRRRRQLIGRALAVWIRTVNRALFQ
jgi:hypothetical protein